MVFSLQSLIGSCAAAPAVDTIPATQATNPSGKLPPPSDVEFRDAQGVIDEVFGDRLRNLASASDKFKLAADMVDVASRTPQPASRFALLRKAEELATEAADVDSALAVHQKLADQFDLGKSTAVLDFFHGWSRAATSAADSQKLARAAAQGVAMEIVAGRYESARQILKLGLAWAKRTSDRALLNQLASLGADIANSEAEEKRLAPALTTLEKNPADGPANTQVGSYRCFIKADWTTGLPLLAKGDNSRLKHLADMELSSPMETAAKVAIADGWWTVSESQTGPARAAVRIHAGMWYADASANLTGLEKVRASQRAADYLKTVAPPAPVASKPPAAEARPRTASPPPKSVAANFTSFEQMLQAIDPRLVSLAANSSDTSPANAALNLAVNNKSATVSIEITRIDRTSRPPNIYVDAVPVKVGSVTVAAHATFVAGPNDPMAGREVGQTIILHGAVSTSFYSRIFIVHLLKPQILSAPPDLGSSAQSPAPGAIRYSTTEQIVAAIPWKLLPPDGAALKQPDKVNAFFKESKRTVPGTFRVQVTPQRLFSAPPWVRHAECEIGSQNGVAVLLDLGFSQDDRQLAQVEVGKPITVSGRITLLGRMSMKHVALEADNIHVDQTAAP
jgi:hypothetical protein